MAKQLPSEETPSSSHSRSSLDDINYLLYLETLKRFTDDEQNIRKQVQQKVQQYNEANAEYLSVYELFIQFYTAAVTRGALEENRILTDEILDQAQEDIQYIIEKISNDQVTALLKPDMLEKCKEILRSLKNHDKAQKIQTEVANQQEAIKAIQESSETTQLKLKSAITQSLNFFVELAQINEKENFEIQEYDSIDMTPVK